MEDYAALAEMLEDLEDIRDARKMLGELKREELVDFRDYVKTRKRKAVKKLKVARRDEASGQRALARKR